MDRLRWTGRTPESLSTASEPDSPGPVERPTPGVAALLDGIREDRSRSVLDLGAAANPSLRVYGRFARWIRFADLLGPGARPQEWSKVLRRPSPPGKPYDLVFAWNILDRLFPEERSRLIRRLAEITADDARIHVVVEASEGPVAGPFRFTLLDVDRMRLEPTSGRSAQGRVLPAELGRLIEPFEVLHGFTLKGGLREYVAVKRLH